MKSKYWNVIVTLNMPINVTFDKEVTGEDACQEAMLLAEKQLEHLNGAVNVTDAWFPKRADKNFTQLY